MQTRNEIISALPQTTRTCLERRAVRKDLNPSEILCLPGEPAGDVWVVTSGALKLTTSTVDGRETILTIALEDDLAGEVAAAGSGYHHCAIASIGRSVVWRLDADLFLRAALSDPAGAELLLADCARHGQEIAETAAERTLAKGPERLAAQILRLADALGRVRRDEIHLTLPMDQRELASVAGMTRESACRVLQRFKRDGLIDYRGRNMRLLRPDLLARIRCGEPAVEPCRRSDVEGARRPRSSLGI